jgi:hypothetical protein
MNIKTFHTKILLEHFNGVQEIMKKKMPFRNKATSEE